MHEACREPEGLVERGGLAVERHGGRAHISTGGNPDPVERRGDAAFQRTSTSPSSVSNVIRRTFASDENGTAKASSPTSM